MTSCRIEKLGDDVVNAIVNILPLALGVAISPIPIIAVILMLLSPKARINGLAFLLGWVVGLAVVGIVVTVVSGNAGLGSGGGGSLKKLRSVYCS